MCYVSIKTASFSVYLTFLLMPELNVLQVTLHVIYSPAATAVNLERRHIVFFMFSYESIECVL